jgi:hypothetical protein
MTEDCREQLKNWTNLLPWNTNTILFTQKDEKEDLEQQDDSFK